METLRLEKRDLGPRAAPCEIETNCTRFLKPGHLLLSVLPFTITISRIDACLCVVGNVNV